VIPEHRICRKREYPLRSDPLKLTAINRADQIRRTLSLASLDQLLVLSANQAGERDRLLAQVSRVGKDLVWREHNEKRLLPRDTERALVLAFKRGMRESTLSIGRNPFDAELGSLLLAFSVRAGVNVILVQFRTLQRRGLQFRLLWHAAFGAEPLRFGAMIGRALSAISHVLIWYRHIYLLEYSDTPPSTTRAAFIVLPSPLTQRLLRPADLWTT